VKRTQLLRDAYAIFEVTIPDALSQKSIEPNSDSMVGNYLISLFLTRFRTSTDADIPATGSSLSSFFAMVNRL
jgi:hypothetical protein